ncbi:uncharacterized protein LOC128228168 [Mya arenaria]|uniref:uncharacterized protein LOC128228168 n=1 Tax=Mya arenaria TaxID=6604 RepID=UPI0022E45BF9|nr:uncharacterized protein LOC128228168 [Mya arenaria]
MAKGAEGCAGEKVAQMLATVEVDIATVSKAFASSNPLSLPMLATAPTSEAAVPAARTDADVSFPDVPPALAPVAVAPAAITHVVVALSAVVPTTATVAPAAMTSVDVPTSEVPTTLAPATVTHADFAPSTYVSTPEVSTTPASETPARWPSFRMARPSQDDGMLYTILASLENHNRQISNQLANYNRQVLRQIEAINKKVDALRAVVDVSTVVAKPQCFQRFDCFSC